MIEHIPVLADEVLDYMQPRADGSYIDATVGLGGHAAAILDRSGPTGRLLGLDADPEAVHSARERLAPFGSRVEIAQSWHRDLATAARQRGLSAVQGILLDLGVSSLQLDDPARGFGFGGDGPLDMRMGGTGTSARDIVNEWPEEELSRIIYEYGEERHARRIAAAIVRSRPVMSTTELADLVAATVRGAGGHRQRIHPATRTFQALRIAVNDELASLESVLPQALGLLAPGGRLLVIAFHSLEDRIVKHYFRREARDCICPPRLPCVCDHRASIRILTNKPVRPTASEIARNPRSRSARLRVAERLPVSTARCGAV